MCGIIGVKGNTEAYPVLVEGLEQLEYRGYDSAGICTFFHHNLLVQKKKGRVANLKEHSLPGTVGIGHTRWSTHGVPSDRNAHPFVDESREFAVVHNGIIENYLELKEELRKKGIHFTSDTDSEVIVHLLATEFTGEMMTTLQHVVKKLHGAYAFCVIHKGEIYGVRNGSPLVLGIGEQQQFFGSDVSAFVKYTKKVLYLEDYDIVHLSEKPKIITFQGTPVGRPISEISWDIEQAQKQGHDHFMRKEIQEQPQVIEETMAVVVPEIPAVQRIILVACGTAYYAGLVGSYWLQEQYNVVVDTASEFRYKKQQITKDDLVIVISQSGETADTLAALRLAKEKGAMTWGIINVKESTIAREVDKVIYTQAGAEMGVASTKAFAAQITLLAKLAGVNVEAVSGLVTSLLEKEEQIREVARKYFAFHNMLYIGRQLNYPLALEGALKLKEISYIHAEAYPAGELKHGPIALISEEMPTIALCPQDSVYEKTFSNLQEIKSRNGILVGIGTEGDTALETLCDDVIFIPKVDENLLPFVMMVPLQLVAYHIAVMRECDVDKPRNLAKSVTVE